MSIKTIAVPKQKWAFVIAISTEGLVLQWSKKRELTAWREQNIFSLMRGKFFLAPLYEAELRYQYNFAKKNCLTIIGKLLIASPGLLTFFFFL